MLWTRWHACWSWRDLRFGDFNEWNNNDNLMIDGIKPTSSSAKNKYTVGSEVLTGSTRSKRIGCKRKWIEMVEERKDSPTLHIAYLYISEEAVSIKSRWRLTLRVASYGYATSCLCLRPSTPVSQHFIWYTRRSMYQDVGMWRRHL